MLQPASVLSFWARNDSSHAVDSISVGLFLGLCGENEYPWICRIAYLVDSILYAVNG